MPDVRFDASLPDSPAPPAALVPRSGKIFELGVYEDKDFSLSEAEADAAIAAFTPQAADLEHQDTVLSGHLGHLVRVWREGTALCGTVDVPAWLDPLLAPTGRKLSLAWDRPSKTICGWGWVRTPRVTDAALYSAYAAFAGARHSATDQADLNAALEHLIQAGAASASPAPPPKEARMSLWDSLRAALDSQPAAFQDESAPVEVPPSTGAPPAPPPLGGGIGATFAAERAALDADRAAFAATQQAQQAATWAETVLTDHVGALPATLRPALTALFALTLADDARTPTTVTFSDPLGSPQSGNRAALLQAVIDALPTGTIGGAHVAAFVLPAAPTPQAEADATQARNAALLATTPLGRAARATTVKEK